MLVALVSGCSKKEEDPAGATSAQPTAAATTEAPSATTTATTDVAPVAPLAKPTTAATAATGAAATTTATDAAVATDASTNSPDASTAGHDCCCEVAGKPLSTVEQHECVKTQKGQCVKKDKCEKAAAAAAATTAPDAGAGQTCCCDADGKKSIAGQSECTKGGKGKCIKMTECKK